MNELLSFVVLVALTIGITEVIKLATKISKNTVPLIALIVGFCLTLIGHCTDITSLTILAGIAVGLSASGLFDQKKLLSLLK